MFCTHAYPYLCSCSVRMFVSMLYIRVLVFMLYTCDCVHVAYTCACVHIAYMCLCSCRVRVFVFMLHACAELCSCVRMLVFMLRTCVCVHVAYVCLCSCCIRALVFMLPTCAYIHVAYMCLCSCSVRTFVFLLHVRVRVFMYVCLCSCCIYQCLCSYCVHVLVLMSRTCVCVHVAYVRLCSCCMHVRNCVHVYACLCSCYVRVAYMCLCSCSVRVLVFMLHIRVLVFISQSGTFYTFCDYRRPHHGWGRGGNFWILDNSRCLNNAILGRIWDIYWISKLPILLLFWRENKYLTRPKVEFYINCRDRIIVIEVIKESKILFKRHTDVCTFWGTLTIKRR